MGKHERTAVVGIVVSIALGILIGLAGSDNASQVGGIPLFLLLTGVAFAINAVAFVPSFIARTEHYYDLTGSLTYITTTVLALVLASDLDTRSTLIGLMVLLWSGRLGSFLFKRVKQSGKDGRFDQIKQSFLRFLMAWMIQGLWVTLTAGAAFAAIASGDKQELGFIGAVGFVIWALGFAIEVASDNQKTAFKADPKNDGKFINVGLWSWSRHPNYFGEIMLWTGMAILAFPALSGWQHVTLISPLFVYLLLTRVSGVPMLERRADKKWGGQANYRAYKAATLSLIHI